MLNSFKKDEDSGDAGVFYNIDKSVVLQEARAFNVTPINPRKCRLILTKIVYLLYQSETFATNEATEAFFSITKLFQSNDIALRQMVYLLIKELSKIAENTFIITSSLTKDMTAKTDVIYRANSIRALCKITDASMLQGIERFLKQAIVDKSPSVSSAALVSAHHIFGISKEVVKRWANEVQEAINSKGIITQYHALGLMYQIRQHDRMAVIKLIRNYSKGLLRSPYAYCMLIRYIAKVMEDDDADRSAMYELLENFLRHKNEMVIYEAARAICGLKDVSNKELFPAVAALQLMLSNHKSTLCFAAIRTLSKLAMTNPVAVSPCNLDMENLIVNSNRSIATFAITTLLKTGNEASVDRLMKQITGFMSEISDEFKIIVIDAVRSLCLKFPTKQQLMLNFLANALREEGGYEYKRGIVEAIFDIIYHIPESKEHALSHLCEFIEDCEFTKLAVRILHLLGSEGPKTSQPSKCIRYIYNRVILENATVRVAAVSALVKFAIHCGDLTERIKVLLTRCLDDVDDEVRDRASMALRLLDDSELSKRYLDNESTFSLASLERSLHHYVQSPSEHSKPFDIQSIPVISKEQEKAERARAKSAAIQDAGITGLVSSSGASSFPSSSGAQRAVQATAASGQPDPQTAYAEAMEKIPQLSHLGLLLKSSSVTELTESETEYLVACVRHVFPKHLVFEFQCRNTLNDILLENVHIQMNLEATEDEEAIALLQYELSIPIDRLPYDTPGSIYVVYRRPDNICPTASFSNVLKFIVKDCDPATGEPDEEGYEDEYPLDDVQLSIADYMIPNYVPEFRKAWEGLGKEAEAVETYSLTAVSSIQAAVSNVIQSLGMCACENTGTVKDKAATHGLLIAGTFVGGVPVLARCRMALDGASGVTLEIGVRSASAEVSQRVANAIS
ncbi:adaptin N terminal region-domain-containing protein [Polychytrium aggregatum]|uniref:adaptin N terminal region-domain-containing protein n=1 Tax=Polychytrium aggregatum TaxID=110093 RepID=UPI0022FE13D9|nr:adaptin N terminal region-domain-containing protein [Polychytrium aggregatum]KAI9205702.1 adaptin N terminal region-domain-containing protein [Polychytrium aggregatum]